MNWKVLYPAGKTETDAPRFRDGPVFSSTDAALRYLQATPGTLDAIIGPSNDVGISIKSATTGSIIAYLTSVD
jgi:hypothetical protein